MQYKNIVESKIAAKIMSYKVQQMWIIPERALSGVWIMMVMVNKVIKKQKKVRKI